MLILNSIYITAVRYVSKATRIGMRLTNEKENLRMNLNNSNPNKPTNAYIFATWAY